MWQLVSLFILGLSSAPGFLPLQTASIEVDMGGSWYQSVVMDNVTAEGLGYKVGDLVQITSPGKTFVNSGWGSMTLAHCGVAYGDTESITTCKLTDTSSFSSSFTFGLNAHNAEASHAKGTVTIKPYIEPSLGTLTVSITTEKLPPGENPPFTLTSESGFNKAGLLDWLAPTTLQINSGTYQLSTPSYTDKSDTYTPNSEMHTVVITKDIDTKIDIDYAFKPIQTFEVQISVSGLPANSSATITLSSTSNSLSHQFSTDGNGSVELPQTGATYTVSSSFIAGYSPTFSPASFSADGITTQITVKFAKQTNKVQFGAYWAGWTGNSHVLTDFNEVGLTALYLAFANYSSGVIDTSVSGYLSDVPKEGSQLWPSYQDWTSYAYANPNTDIILSLGGATFSGVWNSLDSVKIQGIVSAVGKIFNTQYPVYNGSFAKSSDLIGHVRIIGIDLDVELGGARLSTQVSSQVAVLIKALRAAYPTNLITIAAFSVGADPPDACTVPLSDHCGETIDLLKAAGQYLDYINVMAYDAGKAFATSKYQIAMANYSQLVPSHKVILGLDNQSQWPGFIETSTQIVGKAEWAFGEGNIGGAFLWEIGGLGNPLTLLQSISKVRPQFRAF